MSIIDTKKFHYVVNKLRSFFIEKGFLECHTQNRLSILAACEDPSTITCFNYAGDKWPLPQTGQMWLEWEMMKNPEVPGYFVVSTSYRQEPNPIPGRHDLIFPMFEFEFKGNINDLEKLERELLLYLGYGERIYPSGDYEQIAKDYETYELHHEHEQRLYKEYGNAFFLKNFPEYTSPFWNMKRNNNKTANKIDVILSGMETIGSAERAVNIEEMSDRFKSISNGMYANTLYNHFGKERIDKELGEYFGLEFIERSGGGIGITRLIRSMEMEGLIPE